MTLKGCLGNSIMMNAGMTVPANGDVNNTTWMREPLPAYWGSFHVLQAYLFANHYLPVNHVCFFMNIENKEQLVS